MIDQLQKLYTLLIDKNDNRKIKILFLHNKSQIGGGERSLINLWKHLESKTYDVYLMLPGQGLLKQEAEKMGLSVGICRVPKLSLFNLFSVTRTVLKLMFFCLSKKIDLIHSYTPRNNILSGFVGTLLRIPVVWHERNLIYKDKWDVSRKFVFLPDLIICNSDAIARRFRYGGQISKKVRTVLNGVDVESFKPGDKGQEILDQYGLGESRVVGLVTSLDRRKRPEYLLEAAPAILKECPDTLFLIVGGEYGEEAGGRQAALTDLARTQGLVDRVVFTGFLQQVPDVIRVFDVGVAVTEKEACSRAILEIMASGKPVVAFDTGGNPELIKHGRTGHLVAMGDIEALANSVIDLLKDDKKREQMGENARIRAVEQFDIRLNARKTKAVYSELLG